MEQTPEAAHAVGALLALVPLLLIVCAILMVPTIFYLLTLQKALNRCSPECRAMTPGLVWLMLIPLFNIVWQFFVVLNMAKSLAAEFQKRGIAEDPNPGQTLGLVMCIGNLICRPGLLDYLLGQNRRLLRQTRCAGSGRDRLSPNYL
ncbi:MAG: hypothetical protein NT154_06885 [Verrucomicrobia bacterium]|nr:hypothetical protein [Verrucomicrobiota bacterium]